MPDFRYTLAVDVHDVDYNGVAKASSLMKYMQTAAQSQLTSIGLSYDQLKVSGRAFLLSRMKMEFYEPIRAYEPLTAISYPCESRAFSFLRCYALERDGAVVGRAASIWALVDIESRALVPVTGIDMDLELLPHNDMSIDRIVMPKSITEVGTYTVTVTVSDNPRVFKIYSELPESERLPQASAEDFSLTGTAEPGGFDGTYDSLLIVFICLAVIFAADWAVYCYEKYKLR